MDTAPCGVCRGRGVVIAALPYNSIVYPVEHSSVNKLRKEQVDAIKETLDDAGL